MKDKRVLITGVGKAMGLGYEVARQCIAEGAEVWVTARNASVAESLAKGLGAAHAQRLDITDQDSILALASRIANEGGLDVLINNAAAMSPWGEQAQTADLAAARDVLDVTLFGTWAVTQALLPILRNSPSGRVVNVSSGAGSHGDTVFGLTTDNQMGTSYAVAKAALNALTVKMAREETGGVLINAVCPGFTATFEGGAEMGARPVSDGAKSILWAARLPNGGPTGGFFRDGETLAW